MSGSFTKLLGWCNQDKKNMHFHQAQFCYLKKDIEVKIPERSPSLITIMLVSSISNERCPKQPQTQWENIHQLYPSALSSMPLTHSWASVSYILSVTLWSGFLTLDKTHHLLHWTFCLIKCLWNWIYRLLAGRVKLPYFSCGNAAFKGQIHWIHIVHIL